MAARQSVTITAANNPRAKFKMNYLRYKIYHNDGSYTYGVKKYMTRKNNEWAYKEDKPIF